MLDQFFKQITEQNKVREALSGIRAAVKDKTALQKAKEHFGSGGELTLLLSSEDAKTRKNAAALIGDLKIEEAASALYQAYEKEETLFVRATLLKALEQTDVYPYLGKLGERYECLCEEGAADASEAKHIREELHALERILRREGRDFSHTFIGWNQKVTVLLTTNPKYAALTAEKLPAYRKNITSLGVQAVVDNLREVIEIRTFRELLFPVPLGGEIFLKDGAKAFADALLNSKLLSLIEQSHREGAPFSFRIDLKGGLPLLERGRYIKQAAAVIEENSGRKLINAPDGYEFEIRLLLGKEGKLHAFLKMFTIPMDRFAYRKETISASIQPSVAAMLLELAKPYLNPDAYVLDPCCGVGTMLIERRRLKIAKGMYGVDLFGEAIEKARVNVKAAGLDVNLVRRDYLEFNHSYQFDEIIANMPMKGKRTKQEQDGFYAGFFDKSQELLAKDGVLILYSNENGFVKKQLRLHPAFRLCKEYLILEKEQFYLYIIGRKESKRFLEG